MGSTSLLAAAHEVIAEYFSDVDPHWKEESEQFIEHDLVQIRDEMLNTVKDQQASEVFLETLGVLLELRWTPKTGRGLR